MADHPGVDRFSQDYRAKEDFHDRSLSRGQKLSRRASEERVYKFFSDSSPRVLASQPWFLFPIEPDFHDRSLSRGQKLSRRASEERVYKFFSDSSPRVLASQPWFLFPIEPDFHLLSQTSEWSLPED